MDSQRCQYGSKPCDQTRSFKENGERHRLCAFHRERANDAQRRWHSRQRAGIDTTSEPDSGAEVSARTLRRRRAAQAAREAASPLANTDGAVAPLRRRVRARPTKQQNLTFAPPASPLSVDSATFTSLLHAPPPSQAIAFDVVDGDERLSAEDLALLDELMFCIAKTTSAISTTDCPHAHVYVTESREYCL